MAKSKAQSDNDKGENPKDYELQSIRIRAIENGYVVSVETRLTDAAQKKKRAKAGNKSNVLLPDTYKTEEFGASSVEDVLNRVKEELTEYSPVSAFDSAFDEGDSDGDGD